MTRSQANQQNPSAASNLSEQSGDQIEQGFQPEQGSERDPEIETVRQRSRVGDRVSNSDLEATEEA